MLTANHLFLFGQNKNHYVQSINEWHAKRENDLKQPNGWLNLEGLFWLHKGANSFGKAEGMDSKYANKEFPDYLGDFIYEGDSVQWVNKNNNSVKIDNKEIKGEYKIGNSIFSGKSKPDFRLHPHAWINPIAKKAILDADAVIIAPGNFYGSIIPALIVDGVPEALSKTKALKIQITNLVTKPGQTDGWDVTEYANEIERLIGKKIIDYVIYNTKKPSSSMLTQYAKDKEYPVAYNTKELSNKTYKTIGENILDLKIQKKYKNDKIERTLIRHDSEKICKVVINILSSKSIVDKYIKRTYIRIITLTWLQTLLIQIHYNGNTCKKE